jgi:hypothetical protein
VPEIAEFAVAANKDRLLDIVAIAEPVGADDEGFSGAIWINQQITAVPFAPRGAVGTVAHAGRARVRA